MEEQVKCITYSDPYKKKNTIVSDEEHPLYDQSNHLDYLIKIRDKINFEYSKEIIKSLKTKHYSYRSQDKKSKKFDDTQHITFDQLVDKLIESKLICFYCNENLKLIYSGRKETKQWSLERLDNNLGHYNSNTCISCLKCNLDRRKDNFEYFKLSKNIKIKKV